MQVNIHVKGLPKAAKLRRLATDKLNLALARFAHAVQEASIHLADINGPDRGGVDKLCRVVLRMKSQSVVVIEGLGTDVAHAIDRVTERLQQSVTRDLNRDARIDRDGARPQTLALVAT